MKTINLILAMMFMCGVVSAGEDSDMIIFTDTTDTDAARI